MADTAGVSGDPFLEYGDGIGRELHGDVEFPQGDFAG